MFKLVSLSDGQMTLIDEKHYLDVIDAGPWHFQPAGKNSTGYVKRWTKPWRTRRKQFLHHFIADLMGLEYSQVDHKNGDGLDNTEENLRPATSSQNAMNRGPCSRNNSGVKGVHWNSQRQKWEVEVQHRYLGLYESLEEAAKIANNAQAHYHKEFKR